VPEPVIDVVVVNWNAGPALAECVASLGAVREHLASVVVVDNASSDGSLDGLDALGAEHGLPLVILRNDRNRGFGPACNQGARLGAAEHVLFLNPDTRVAPDSLDRPLELLSSPAGADVGALGIQLEDERGRVARSCARFPTATTYVAIALGLDRVSPLRSLGYRMTEWDHAETRDVDHVMGAFYLIRRATFAAVGGFDERFFVYFEDLDLSRRVRASGKRLVYLAGPRAFHAGGGTTRAIPARRLAYFLRGKLRYARKHERGATLAIALLATALFELPARVLGGLVRGRVGEAAAAVGGFALCPFAEPPRGAGRADENGTEPETGAEDRREAARA